MKDNHQPAKYLKRYFLPLLLVIVLAIAPLWLFVSPSSPLSPMHVCTLMGCSDSLEIDFTHLPAVDYSVLVSADTGETRSATCPAPGQNPRYSATDVPPTICGDDSITLVDFNPRAVTIQIQWSGGSYSTSGQPTYQSFKPNGPGCPPTCKIGKLQVELP